MYDGFVAAHGTTTIRKPGKYFIDDVASLLTKRECNGKGGTVAWL
jgi:hypothetical protein